VEVVSAGSEQEHIHRTGVAPRRRVWALRGNLRPRLLTNRSLVRGSGDNLKRM